MAQDQLSAHPLGQARVLSLAQAVATYLVTLQQEQRPEAQAELARFARWYGGDRILSEVRGHDLALYIDSIGANTPNAEQRLEVLRSFLAHAKRASWTATNLATHVRTRKSGRERSQSSVAPAPAVSQLTPDGYATLQSELEVLLAQRPRVATELQKAMADKDFRENAPLDAIREEQAHLEARIRDLQAILKQAVLMEPGASSRAKVHLGSTVALHNLSTGALLHYTIVDPTEVNTARGRLSVLSPVGRALLEQGVGDEVEVTAPAGVLRFRIEAIEG